MVVAVPGPEWLDLVEAQWRALFRGGLNRVMERWTFGGSAASALGSCSVATGPTAPTCRVGETTS